MRNVSLRTILRLRTKEGLLQNFVFVSIALSVGNILGIKKVKHKE